jgi:homoserine kinase
VAGIVGAFAFKNRYEERQNILELATKIEGHPDNVAPAIFGGLTVSVMEEHKVTTLSIPVKQEYRYVALIPPFTLSTEKARSVLPQTLDRADAIKNVSHLALMVASLINGYDEGLKLGFKDRFHQPYRGHLIDNFFPIMETLEKDERVLGAYLSGAGPTIMALIRADDTMGVVRIKEELGSLIDGWQVEKLELDERGFTCDFL